MIQTPFSDAAKYILCPACGCGRYAVSHLPIGTSTRWYCDNDECGKEFRLTVISPDEIDCEVTGNKKCNTVVTLRCDEPFTMTVSGMRLEPIGDITDWIDSQRYFYEESSCPINSFRAVIEINNASGSIDPHGILKFVKVEDSA